MKEQDETIRGPTKPATGPPPPPLLINCWSSQPDHRHPTDSLLATSPTELVLTLLIYYWFAHLNISAYWFTTDLIIKS